MKPELIHASRFVSWHRLPAVALLFATCALIVYGLFASIDIVDRTADLDSDRTDAALYVAVAARVADGENYYRAAATEHRERGYPLRPFVTVREPALAYVTAVVGGPDRMMRVLGVLAFVVSVAMVWRLEGSASGRVSWWSSALLTAVTAGALVGHIQAVTHEVWAGMLIALSLALRTEKRFAASIGLGLAAVLVRELALPYLLVMAFFAWREGKRREAYAWTGAVAAFAVAFTVHAAFVHAQVGATDPASEGWLRFGGWPFVLDLVRRSSFLGTLPGWVGAAVMPLALLGWSSRRTPFADRVIVTIGAYLCAFMLIGRPENVYWGIMFVLLLIPGVAFAPMAVVDLLRGRSHVKFPPLTVHVGEKRAWMIFR